MTKSKIAISIATTFAMLICLAGPDGNALAQQPAKKKQEAPKQTAVAVQEPDLPDIAIISDQTEVEPGSCNTDDPLVNVTVAVKNNGKIHAERLVAAPIVAVYLPENLDIKDEKIVPNALAPREIFTTDAHPGKGEEKRGRGFNKSVTVYIAVDPYNKIKESNELNNILKKTVSLKGCN